MRAGDKDADAKRYLERPLPLATEVEAASESMRRRGLRVAAGLPPPSPTSADGSAPGATEAAALVAADVSAPPPPPAHLTQNLRSSPVDAGSVSGSEGEKDKGAAEEELGEGELLGAVGVSRDGGIVWYLLEDLPLEALKKVRVVFVVRLTPSRFSIRQTKVACAQPSDAKVDVQ